MKPSRKPNQIDTVLLLAASTFAILAIFTATATATDNAAKKTSNYKAATAKSDFEMALEELPVKVKEDKKPAPAQKAYTCKSPTTATKTMSDPVEFQNCVNNKGEITYGY